MGDARHVVAIIGGATAGAEVASRLADHGTDVVVFDQNTRPFGKIEDGLPRWHVNLRLKEYEAITRKLSHPRVHLMPRTKVGGDYSLLDVVERWGFSAVVLANGAWRDRPLPLKDADKYTGKGVVYQNQYIVWFNHLLDPNYQGPRFRFGEGIAVVGGGLASLDVMKVLSLGRAMEKLKERGIKPHLEDLEQAGIPDYVAKHNLTMADLGIRPSTLYYRRRIEDMPLADAPADATPEKRAKVEAARKKIVDKATEKFGFKVEPLHAPDSLMVEGDRVVGMRLRKQSLADGKLTATNDVVEHRCDFVMGSIGSVPEPLDGVDMEGELFRFVDKESGRLGRWEHVFSTGNVVTGKGNIVVSRRHAVALSAQVAERYLGIAGESDTLSVPTSGAQATARVETFLGKRPLPTGAAVDGILQRVAERQAAVGYNGVLADWLKAHPVPPDDG